jgi:ABC-type nitrate/sulfonate/bicarbonate transport system substrate-binding protein
MFIYFIISLFVLGQPISCLRIATSLAWIEHTPQPYAIKNFYSGSSTASLTSGGVANLASEPQNFELAANAETQGLRQYAGHRNIRLIYIICEVPYRIVANKNKGISKLADLKGKKIGTVKGTSAGVFIHNMMASVGVRDNEYSAANGKVCMKTPCASDTMPAMLRYEDKRWVAPGQIVR